jgi:PilZ domain-containing protein
MYSCDCAAMANPWSAKRQMNPEVLIYSPEASVAAALSAAVKRVKWSPISADREGVGLSLLRGRKYPAIIIDCLDQAAALGLLDVCRRSSSNKTSVVLALTEERDPAISKNANFLIRRSSYMRDLPAVLHAAEGIVRQEFRRYRRVPMDVPVVLSNDEHRIQLTTLNMSEGGMCLIGEVKGWNREHVVQFINPKLNSEFRASSSIIWSDSGRTGVRFQGMSASARVLLGDWLKEHE